MKPFPLRLKLALLSAAISGAVLLAFGVAAWSFIYQQRLEAVDREIRTLASRHPGWFAQRGNFQRLDSALDFTFGEHRKTNIIVLISDRSGTVLYRSAHWPEDLQPTGSLQTVHNTEIAASAVSPLLDEVPPEEIGPPWGPGGRAGMGMGRGRGQGRGGPPQVAFTATPIFSTVATAASSWRLGVFSTTDTTLALGINHDEIEGELAHLRRAFLFTLPAALFFTGLGGWLVARRAMRPLAAIANTAEHVTARGLDQRIPVLDGDPEIDRVVQVLNRMMDRLELSFRQASRFSADASHELRTPLAIMQGELENALQAAAPGSTSQKVFSNLLEETQRLKTITRSLLLLAQADAGQLQLAIKPVNLTALLEELIEDARLLAESSDLRFELQLQPDVSVDADETLFRTALLNLMVNAVKYNEPGGRIAVQLAAKDGQALIEIGNTGPGIPAAEQPKLFQRFYRVDSTRNRQLGGLGLGLSLAREILLAHHGELQLRESRSGWTCFRLRIPAS